MSLLRALRQLLPPRADARGTCLSCAHFCNDPERVEQELPGLAVLSSAYASIRTDDGLCAHHLVLTGKHHGCAAHQAPAEAAG